ncbi:MAG: hypothetical protein CMJ58_23785, partial [Planctomycetaceae bacterium]|nr:hypothetical protein [Planctomycetaceae bacterium]
AILATDDNGDATQRIVTLYGASTLTGNIDVSGKWSLADTGSMLFDIGASGINNGVSGTGFGVFDGTFNFDLTGASSTPGDSWTIASVANQSFGATFAVGGGFSKSGDFWTDGTYLFNPLDGTLSVSAPPLSWNVDGGGNWSVGANWNTGSVPAPGEDVVFGSVLTAPNAPATVSLDVAATVGRVTFSGDNQYVIAGPQALTLAGLAQLSATGGVHEVSATIAGSSGITKTGGGTVVLSGANSYTGLTDVQEGVLGVRGLSSVTGNVSVAAGAAVAFQGDGEGGGYDGTFASDITGAGRVELSGNLTTETVTFAGAKTYSGETTVIGGTLAISNAAALGVSDGTAASRTLIDGNESTGKLALSGNIAVGSEVLVIEAREGAAADAIQATSAGNNSWAGNIKGEVGGTQYNIESTAGTLTIGGVVSAPDSATRNFVFSGAGNFRVTGKITDLGTDADGNVPVSPANNVSSVSVYKRGAGTLTIETASSLQDEFWQGDTVVEEGTLEVRSDGANNGELWSRVIDVRSGATLDVDHFSAYGLQADQQLRGGGTIQLGAGTLEFYNDNVLAPGDGVGTLAINGNVTFANGGFGGGGLNVELGATTAVGGGVNDLVQISGSLSGTGASGMTVNVTPAAGDLASGAYRLISHSGGAVDVGGVTAQIVNANGNPLTTRQSVAVASAAGQVNLNVTGNEAALTWTGASGTAWNVNSTPNWTGGPTFFDLDDVTFNDTAGVNTTIDVSTTDVSPGSVTFASATNKNFTVTGSNGIVTGAPAALTGNVTVSLQNRGNNLAGGVSLADGTTLAAGDGTVLGNVNAANGSTLRIGGAGLQQVLTGTNFTYVDANDASNTTLADGTSFTAVQPGAAAPGVWVDRGLDGGQATLGNGGSIYQAGPDATTDAPTLRTRIAGLAPNTAYAVHVNYWDATGSVWRIQAGDSPNDLAVYDSLEDAVPGATDGVDVATLTYAGTAPLAAEGNRTMFGANVGVIMTDGSGNLDVYVDDSFSGENDPRTWYDGVSYSSTIVPVPGVLTGAESLAIDGDLTLAGSSTLAFDIGQSGYNDFLSITGNLAADGTLEVLLDDDADALAAGDSYDLFDFGSVSGTFATLDLPLLTGSLAWDTSQLLVDGTISVMSLGLAGDFDADGDVDGADFLAWQRNPAVGDLADWQANYGATPTTAAAGTVPEPTSLLLAAGATLLLAAASRRQR